MGDVGKKRVFSAKIDRKQRFKKVSRSMVTSKGGHNIGNFWNYTIY